MEITFNQELDMQVLVEEFARHRRLRIENILTTESAEYILNGLKQTDWHLVHSDDQGRPIKFDPNAQAKLDSALIKAMTDELHQRALHTYQYMYKFYPIIDAIKAGVLHNDSVMSKVASFVNSTQFIHFSRKLTGAASLVKMDPQASLYEAGHFLSMHDDSNYQNSQNDLSKRRFAVVLGFTKNWSSNWGGQTSFYESSDAAEAVSWNPGFNVLTIFEVPILHRVHYVTPFAGTARYSITGWLRDDPTIKRYDLGDV